MKTLLLYLGAALVLAAVAWAARIAPAGQPMWPDDPPASSEPDHGTLYRCGGDVPLMDYAQNGCPQ